MLFYGWQATQVDLKVCVLDGENAFRPWRASMSHVLTVGPFIRLPGVSGTTLMHPTLRQGSAAVERLLTALVSTEIKASAFCLVKGISRRRWAHSPSVVHSLIVVLIGPIVSSRRPVWKETRYI